MADNFTLNGSYVTEPLSGEDSFAIRVTALIDETVQLAHKKIDLVDLDVDTPVVVSLGGLDHANIIILKTVGGSGATVRVTSSKGVEQQIPFDTYFILMSMSENVTALDLVRPTATFTQVRVFLGELA